MKLLMILMSAFIGFGGVTSDPELIVEGPAISFEQSTHDFGDVEQGVKQTCIFVAKNIGSEPLVISECKKSCGCTIPKCDMKPIMPGETSEIEVTYDAKRPGPFNKSVTVRSNAVNESTLVLRIEGTVK